MHTQVTIRDYQIVGLASEWPHSLRSHHIESMRELSSVVKQVTGTPNSDEAETRIKKTEKNLAPKVL